MRPLPENHTRWPVRGFAPTKYKWSQIVTSGVFDRARAERARRFSPWDKANIAPPEESRRCPSSGNTRGTSQTRPGRSEILLCYIGPLSYGNFSHTARSAICAHSTHTLAQCRVSGGVRKWRLRAGQLDRRTKPAFADVREIDGAPLRRPGKEQTRLARTGPKSFDASSNHPERASTDGGTEGVRARKFCTSPEVASTFEFDLAPPLRNPDGRRLVFQTSHSLLSATTRRSTPRKRGQTWIEW